MRVFLTKHALTEGIVEVEAELSPRSPEVIKVGEGLMAHHYRKPDWHDNRVDAVAASEQVRDSRIAELVLEVNRLKAIRF